MRRRLGQAQRSRCSGVRPRPPDGPDDKQACVGPRRTGQIRPAAPENGQTLVRERRRPVACGTHRHGEDRQPRRVGPVELPELAPPRRLPPRQRAHPHVDFAGGSAVSTPRRRHMRRRPPEAGVELISTLRPTADAAMKSTTSPQIHRFRIPSGTAVPPFIVAQRRTPVAPVFPSPQVWLVPPRGVPPTPIVALPLTVCTHLAVSRSRPTRRVAQIGEWTIPQVPDRGVGGAARRGPTGPGQGFSSRYR